MTEAAKKAAAPWIIREVGPSKRYIIERSTDDPVCMTYGQAEQDRDARLIAAAPDLLKALQFCVESVGTVHVADNGCCLGCDDPECGYHRTGTDVVGVVSLHALAQARAALAKAGVQ